jgi:hypothetical protein
MNEEFDFWESLEDDLDKQFPKGECEERGNALVLFAKFHIKVTEFINELREWTYKNNTIEFKDSKMKLAILDGGWVNVIKLHNKIDELTGRENETNN